MSEIADKKNIDLVKIGQQIRERRLKFAMTQEQVAMLTGVGRELIVKIEKGHPGVAIGKIAKIAKSLGLTLTVVAT